MGNQHLNNIYLRLVDYAEQNQLDEAWVTASFCNILSNYWAAKDERKIHMQSMIADERRIFDLVTFCDPLITPEQSKVFGHAMVINMYDYENDLDQCLTRLTNLLFNYSKHSGDYQEYLNQLILKIGETYSSYILELLRIYIIHDYNEELLNYSEKGAVLMLDFIKRLTVIHKLNLNTGMSFHNGFHLLDSEFFNTTSEHMEWYKAQEELVKFHQTQTHLFSIHNNQLYYRPDSAKVINIRSLRSKQRG